MKPDRPALPADRPPEPPLDDDAPFPAAPSHDFAVRRRTLIAVLVAAIGLEQALTVWNDQLALLPWGLSRILGITVYLGIPAETPWWIAAVGAIGLLAGLALAVPTRRRAPEKQESRRPTQRVEDGSPVAG